MSISIAASPPDWGDTFQPLYDSLSSGCQEWITDAARGVGLGYAYVFEWTPQQYAQLTTEILNYFHTASSATSFGMVTPSRSDSKIGYASGYGFTLSYPDSSSCSYALPNSILTLYDRYSSSDHPYPYISSSFNRGFVVTNNDGFGYMFFSYYGSAGHWYNTTFSVYRYYDGSYGSFLRNNSTYDATFQMPFSQNVMNNSGNYFFDSDGFFYKYKEVNGRICFVDVADSTHIYNNLSFSGIAALCDWFLNSCGLVTDSYSTAAPYEAPVTDTGFEFDETEATTLRSENVTAADNSGSISTVIPSTNSEVLALNDTPTVVTDVSAAAQIVGIYPDDLPKIDKSPALWQTKFPFCIPFDLARIVGDLNAPAEIPQLSFLILPENFFGLDNPAYYVDVDFTMFSDFISILRFFISLGFVLFLILITREIIKG